MLKKIFEQVRLPIAVALVCAAMIAVYPLRAQLNAPQTWAGTAGGTSSAITIGIHGVNSASDLLAVPLRFLPSGTNPGAATVTVNIDGGGSIGPYAVVKQTTAGLAALVGNELQANQIVSVMLDGSTNCSGGPCFQCLTCAPTVPAGVVADFSGPTIPSGWLKADGTAYSRTAQGVLFNALFIQNVSATTNNGQPSVVVSSAGLQVGWYVGGSNVVCNSQITSIPDGAHVVINNNATNSGATQLTFGPYQQGDCATTFNVPNYTGKVTAGVDGSTNITSTTCTNPASIGDKQAVGQSCGSQTQTLTASQIPSISVGPGGGNVLPVSGGVVNGSVSAGTGLNVPASTTTTFQSVSTLSSINTGGQAHPIQPSTSLTYKIIKT